MRLKNKRKYLTQWDKGQVLIVDEYPQNTQVHFSNKKCETAYVLETDENLEVEIPDILLQDPLPITIWIYKIDGTQHYAESKQEYQVIKRVRPESYVYTDTEKRYWEDKLDKQLGAENYGKLLAVGENGEITLINPSNTTTNNFLVYNKTIASNEWLINHHLKKFPSVIVLDNSGLIITGEIDFLNLNSLKITFSEPLSGRAFLS